jgi:chlorite dismutase
MTDLATRPYIQALALGLDPAWRRLPLAEREADAAAFAVSVDTERPELRTFTYSMIGLEPGVDILIWRLAATVDALEEAAAADLRTGLGRWLTVRRSFLGLVNASQYVAKASSQEQSAFDGARGRYLVVYPFTKSTDWYLLGREARQGIMNEHMRIGRGYPQIRQLLAYSFGLDDQDFVVAYEMDDLPGFGDLVRELRGSDSRRSTVNDTPILTGVQRPIGEIVAMLGGAAAEAPRREPSLASAGSSR